MNWSSAKWGTSQNRSTLVTRHIGKCLVFTGVCTVDCSSGISSLVQESSMGCKSCALSHMPGACYRQKYFEPKGRRPIRQHSTSLKKYMSGLEGRTWIMERKEVGFGEWGWKNGHSGPQRQACYFISSWQLSFTILWCGSFLRSKEVLYK